MFTFLFYWFLPLVINQTNLFQMQEAKRLAQSQSMLPNGDVKVKSEL